MKLLVCNLELSPQSHCDSLLIWHQCIWSWVLGPQTWIGTTPVVPLVLRSSDLEWIPPLAFLVLYLADGRLWDFLTSIIVWANSCNKYSLYLYVVICLCFAGEPWLIYSPPTTPHHLPTPLIIFLHLPNNLAALSLCLRAGDPSKTQNIHIHIQES